MTAWCRVCGDVEACLHRPDEIVRAAWKASGMDVPVVVQNKLGERE